MSRINGSDSNKKPEVHSLRLTETGGASDESQKEYDTVAPTIEGFKSYEYGNEDELNSEKISLSEIQENRQYLAELLSLAPNPADDEDNWDETGPVPIFKQLPNPGDLNRSLPPEQQDIVSLFTRLRRRYGKLMKSLPRADKHRSVIRSHLDNLLAFDIGIGVALDEVTMELQEADMPQITTTAFSTMKRHVENIDSLLMLRAIIYSAGLIDYEEEIMKSYIQTLFAKKVSNKSDVMDFMRQLATTKGV